MDFTVSDKLAPCGTEDDMLARIPSGAPQDAILDALFEVIVARKSASSAKSYTAQLLAGGIDACAAKISEEAQEFITAAQTESDDAVAHEAADLIYHLLVMLAARDVPFTAVLDELDARTARSGLDEKASRTAAE